MHFFKFSILAYLIVSLGIAQAQPIDVLRQEIKPNGQVYDITVTPQDGALKTVELYYVTKGNLTQTLTAYLEGVQGAKASISASYLPNARATASLLNKKNGWWNLSLRRNNSKISQKTISMLPAMMESSIPGLTGIFGGSMCSFMSQAEIKEMLTFFTLLYGRTVTKEEFCSGSLGDSGSGGNGGSTSPLPNGVSASTLLHKDNCRSASSKMLVKLSIDLKGVPASALAQGYVLRAGLDDDLYSGSRKASIKPTSEGRFAPRPLILMATMGGCFTGSENIKVVTWSKRGPKETGNIKVVDCVFWQGNVLSRAPIGGLNGGKANYTLTNGYSAYNVCFSQSRTRQRANGY